MAIYGYGTFRYQDRPWRSHMLAWTLIHGPIPAGMKVLHKCDNPPCCNPAHLRLGTQADNVADMHAKGRAHKAPTAILRGTCLYCGATYECLARYYKTKGRKFCSHRCVALARHRGLPPAA